MSSRFRSLRGLCLFCLIFGGRAFNDTIVLFETVLGNFEVQLYDRAGPSVSTPQTAANFLNYVVNGDYQNTFLHRSVPGFVIQGGGFTIENNTLDVIPQNPPVVNEPGNTNVRGTIAMAKIGGDPDSATNQWFFNLGDNSANLDNQNGGFTVFGHVLGNGMAVVDALAAVTAYDASVPLGSAVFNQLPLLNPVLTEENFLIVQEITVVPFELTAIGMGQGGVTLSWKGAGDTPVEVQRATNLDAQDWQTLATVTDAAYTDASPPATGPVYYRLRKP